MSFGYEAIPDFVDWTNPINLDDRLNDGLVAKHLAVEGGGYGGNKWLDLCGKNNGTLTNMTSGYGWQGPQSRPGGWGSMRFDRSDDYIPLGDPVLLKPSYPTVTAWVNTADTTNSKVVIRARLGGYCITFGSVGAGVEGPTNRPTWFIYNGSAFAGCYGSTSIADGLWHFIVGTYDGVTGRLYIDGRQVATFSTTGAVSYPGGGISIGRDGNNPVGYFSGYIDDVSIYNRALSSGEVAGLYEASMNHYPTQLNRFSYRRRYVPSGFNPAWAARSTITLQPGCAA